MEKIKVGAVSYLNTKPMLYGIERLPIRQKIDLVTDYPAKIAQQLLDGTIDVGLVPVAIIPKLAEHHIVTDFCIGATGPVASVSLFSEVPMEQVKSVLLDYQSRTSVRLARVLLKNYWQKDFELLEATEGYQEQIKGTTAGVVIGDRAFAQRQISPYVYDLAEAWKAYTGLPFVFAAWVANKKLPDDFVAEFNEANALGFSNLPEVIAENPYDKYSLQTYYTENVSYQLDEQKRNGLNRFLAELKALEL
jgi:chorismate dehydratase